MNWADTYDKIDPDRKMPLETYNNLRLKYFNEVIRPKVSSAASVDATYQEFLKRTERPKTGTEIGQQIGHAAGSLLVQGAELAGLTALTGPISAGLSRTLLGAGTLANVAAKIGRGGLAFAAYDAMEAKDGDRVAAGLRGAAIGGLWEAGFGAVLGFGEQAAANLTKDTINEESRALSIGQRFTRRPAPETGFTHRPSPKRLAAEAPIDVDFIPQAPQLPPGPGEPRLLPSAGPRQEGTARGTGGQMRRLWSAPGPVAESLQTTVVEARRRAFFRSPPRETPSVRGMHVIVDDAQGNPQILNVGIGREGEAIGQIEEILANGGSIDTIHYHPASRARVSEFIRHFADQAESEDRALRMNVTPGQAEAVAARLNQQGFRGTVVDDSTVLVGPEAPWVKAQKARALAQAGQAYVAGGKTTEVTGDLAQKGFRIGELRTLMQSGPQPRALHAELHHLQGEIGQQTGILNRADLGKLGLRYFERTVSGEKVSFEQMLADYKGKRGPIGERPPLGNKEPSGILKGYRKATANEDTVFGLDEVTGEIRSRPAGTTRRVTQTSRELGFRGMTLVDDPMRVLAADATVSDAYHEAVHEGLIHTGLHEEVPRLAGDHVSTALDIGRGLRGETPSYQGSSPSTMVNEAFAHAAEAVRMGDTERLAQLAKWDKSLAHVNGFVHNTAQNALEASMTGDTAAIRAFQRRMNDLMRRTDPMRSAALQRAQVFGYTTWFNPEIGQWVMRDGEGRELLKMNLDDVWSHIEQADPSSHFPDIAQKAYFKGLRGPLVPTGTEPVDGPTTLELADVPLGGSGISALILPQDAWAAGVQRRLKKLGAPVDFYGPATEVRNAARNAYWELEQMNVRRDSILKGVPYGRYLDYGELASYPESEWAAHAKTLGLSTDDLANIRKFAEDDRANVAAGGVSLLDTLKQIRQVREVGGDVDRALGGVQSPATAAMKRGVLNDLNIGGVSQWVNRQSVNQRFLDEPIAAFEKLHDIKTATGKPAFRDIEYAMRNFIRHVRQIPDKGEQLLSRWTDQMFTSAVNRLNKINQRLPEGLRRTEDIRIPRDILGKYQKLLYLGGLGGRPAVGIRDMFQASLSIPVMGPKAFSEGMSLAMTKEGWAEAQHVLMTRHRIGQIFGDLASDMPVGKSTDAISKMADALLAPSRWGHNIPRAATYLGEKRAAMRAISRYRAGEITDPEELANATSAWFQRPAPKSRLLAMAADSSIPIDKVADEFGRALVDATQYGAMQGVILRTGMGRLFGQYGSWPMSHLQFARTLLTRAWDTPRKGVPALLGWMAINYGAFEAAKSMGIDASKWLFFSPAGYAGSPNAELARDLMVSLEETPEGLQARRRIREFPLELVPGQVELNAIWKAFEENDLSMARLLGFKPLTQQQELDWDDWLLKEGGFKVGP